MIPALDAEAFLVTRELYGHLVTLAARPLSRGNEIAYDGARHAVADAVDRLAAMPAGVLPAEQVALMRALIEAADPGDFRLLASTFVRSVQQAIRADGEANDDWLVFHGRRHRPDPAIDSLAVSVGPTIGIGDELIAARSLARRAARCGVVLVVETRRPGLWALLEGKIELPGLPPLAMPAKLDALSADGRSRTGLVYLDFLESDPSFPPRHRPEGLAFTARWVMGNATGVIVPFGKRALHHLRIPEALGAGRGLECDWMAGRLMAGPGAPGTAVGRSARPEGATERVLLQVLTSKPALILPETLYARALFEARRLADRPFEVRVLSGTTEGERRITREAAEGLARALPRTEVRFLEPMTLAAVAREVARADVLVGPDTFTAHMAALAGTPQITVGLTEHGGWKSPGTAGFYLAPTGEPAELARAIARRVAFALQAERLGPNGAEARASAKAWRESYERLTEAIRDYLYEDRATDPRAEGDLAWLMEILAHADAILAGTLSSAPLGPYARLGAARLADYEDFDDVVRALIGWHHEVGTSDLSAVLHSVP
ncbi:MAG: hypothetical protein KC466_13605 [Myxococcales bacterium]|nr:hypothetical protein [Myxococcales bacterium]